MEMTGTTDNLEKILFRYYSDVLDETTVETLWAEIIDTEKGIYKLDSIPFYGPLIATGDVFFAEYDLGEDHITFREVLESSENSIVQVVMLKEDADIESIQTVFKKRNCLSELANDAFLAMEVLKETDYKIIKEQLDQYADQEILDYAEPCLSVKHLEDLEE